MFSDEIKCECYHAKFLVRMKREWSYRIFEEFFLFFLTFLVLFSCSSNNSTIEPVSFENHGIHHTE